MITRAKGPVAVSVCVGFHRQLAPLWMAGSMKAPTCDLFQFLMEASARKEGRYKGPVVEVGTTG